METKGKKYTINELHDLLVERFGTNVVVHSKSDMIGGGGSHYLTKDGIRMAQWESQLVKIPPLGSTAPRGPSEYYDLVFCDPSPATSPVETPVEPSPSPAPILTLDAEQLGRRVRVIWIAWAKEQPSPKLSWLIPWEEMSEPDREVDRRIGMQIATEITGRLRWKMRELIEQHDMQMAAIMTATLQNTATSIKDRIARDNPYWTVAYSDVCKAIDREMAHRERVVALEDLLRSACAIAERKGEETAWQRFVASVNKLGLNGVTARTYRVLPDFPEEQKQ